MTVIPELEHELVAMAERHAHPVTGRQRLLILLRSRRRLPVLAVAWGLVATSVALAAGGVIPIGTPVHDPGTGYRRPDSGSGMVVDGSARLLELRVKDPAGGPPWGMRVVSTTRGLGCLQVGRVVGGTLGVLGRNGLFGDDGGFHPLPTTDFTVGTCAQLDSNGRLFTSGLAGGVPAAGTADGACLDPYNTRGALASELCDEADERVIYFGMLGPQAERLTYTAGNGASETVSLVPPYGAYLIVARRDARRFGGMTGGSVEPLNTPITELRFRTGLTCPVTERGFAGGPGSCTIPGYAPRAVPRLTTEDVAAPVRAQLVGRGGPMSIAVSFRARVAVSDASSDYTVTFHAPNQGARELIAPIDRNVRSGQIITARFPYSGERGTYTGQVTYSAATGAAPRGQQGRELTVGGWSLHVP
jgi:hypothetical protein